MKRFLLEELIAEKKTRCEKVLCFVETSNERKLFPWESSFLLTFVGGRK